MRLENNFIFRHAALTPLTVLGCSLDSLEETTSSQTQTEVVLTARTALSHLTTLIDSVTGIHTQEKTFNAKAALNEVTYLFQSKHNCQVHYSNFLPEKLDLAGNKLYFQEIIMCLLNNAYEAYQDAHAVHISMSVRIIQNKIFIGIVDFAKGMTSFSQKVAFLKGISYKESGFGLGLTFVRHTVEKHFQGVLKIMSRHGVGTHVSVLIPLPEPYTQNHELS